MSGAALEHLKEHVIVRAGAGAGKTRRLTYQVLDTAAAFHKEHNRFPRMIVTTFTRKATQELRERLMVTALKERPELIDFVNSRSHLVVSTIHGVLDIYMKRYGGNICIDPGYSILSSTEADRLSRQVVRQLLVGSDEYQNLLELYGFDRLVFCLRKFDEVRMRVPSAQPYRAKTFAELFKSYRNTMVAEVNIVCDSIDAESENEKWLEFSKWFRGLASQLENQDWEKYRTTFIQQLDGVRKPAFTKAKPPVDEETSKSLEAVLKDIKGLCDDVFDPEEWVRASEIFMHLEKMGIAFSEALSDQKIRRGAVEISDLELFTMRCMREHPETVRSFAEEWDYWLIDEYQDTSPFQVDLIRQLSTGKPNFIVGDPQQSIYLFRGARSEVFQQKEKEILAGGGSQDFLKKNYRSRPELLLFFNDLFSRLEVPFQPMDPNIKDGMELSTSDSIARFVVLPKTEDEEESEQNELAAIADHIHNLLKAGAHPEDICVLARTNQTLIDVAGYLAQFHLPTQVHSATGFYSRRETMDALSLLKFLVNPYDNLNTVELLRSPWFRIPDEQLVLGVNNEGSHSHWEKITKSPFANDEAVLRLKDWLSRRSGLGISEVFREALIEAGFVDLSHVHDHSGRRESNIWKLLSKLSRDENNPGFNYLDFICQSERDLRDSSGAEESDAIAAVEPNRINLMTIHASKGLQFKHVIVPRMAQMPRVTTYEDFTFNEQAKLWAVRVPRGEDMDMKATLPEKVWLDTFREQEKEEHARVLYVALTRAVESVFLSWVGKPAANSWASMLRWDLSVGIHEGESYSYSVEDSVAAPTVTDAASVSHEEPRKAWRGVTDTEVRVRQNTSVTEILDRSAAIMGTRDVLTIPIRLKLAAQGTAVHRLLEALKSPSTESVRNLVKRWFPGKEEKVTKAVAFVTSVSEPPLKALIQEGFVEWGFAFLHNGVLIEGQIDLWGREGSTVWVADYKTGSPEGREKAFKQLALYALALRKGGEVKKGDTVRLAAIYPFAEQIYIEDEPAQDYYAKIFTPN